MLGSDKTAWYLPVTTGFQVLEHLRGYCFNDGNYIFVEMAVAEFTHRTLKVAAIETQYHLFT